MSDTLDFGIQADKNVVVRGEESERIIEIRVKAPMKERDNNRPEMNLALVIDRSGSMNGTKLAYACKAATYVVDMLESTDRLALVVFDNEVDSLFPSVRMNDENRADMREAIRRVESRGSTNLSGGWLAGCHAVAETLMERGLNRTLLLTDGRANMGIVDPVEISTHADELNERGVSTTTLGVGLDYDHFLLERMAERGGGNYYFIEDPSSIPDIFEKELHELAHITARSTEILVSLPKNCDATVLGGWSTRSDLNGLRINIGNLASGLEKRIYLKARFGVSTNNEPLGLSVRVFARNESDEVLEGGGTLTFDAVSISDEKGISPDEQLMSRFAEVDMAEAANEALKMEYQGNRKEAGAYLLNRTRLNSNYLKKEEIQEYGDLSNRMGSGLDERDRKKSNYAANIRRKVREQ